MQTWCGFVAWATLTLASMLVQAEPLVPHDDAQVVETLPAVAGDRAEERRLRREWTANPRDPGKALALARRQMALAHAEGDPRRAGQALAALQAWPDPRTAPDEVLLMRATIEQYLHEFEAAASHLELLLQRQPQHAQAWLTLATVRRVQGRYAASDSACAGLAATGSALFAQACRAENDGLRGDAAGARASLLRLSVTPRIDAGTRAWLLTSLAELEARAGDAGAAEAAYRRALAVQRDAYTTMSYADFLIQQQRFDEALSVLKDEPRTDAVLLRLAIAGTRAKAPGAERDAREMRERIRLASLRPDARSTHAREQAMFALWVDAAASRALQLARLNVRQQREPLDLLVLAQAARAAGRPAAIEEADTIRKEMGLHDQRLDALL